jgi:hypothetical protein
MSIDIEFEEKIRDAVTEILKKPKKKSEFMKLFRQKTGYKIVFDPAPIVVKEKQHKNKIYINGFFLHKLLRKGKTYYMETETKMSFPIVQREGEPVIHWMIIYGIYGKGEVKFFF